jgi:HD-GYP domain-containing protein (c-di-GMP phosphodiesterase class II)
MKEKKDTVRAIERHLPEMLERAAVLADIGNHQIPSNMLESAAALSAEDLTQVRRHAEFGALMLQEVLAEVRGGRVFSLAGELALSHHENFDGSGYPNRLKGEDIPLSGRIVAVADCYLAITSPRPWRAAIGHEQALEMIRQDSGGKFDPRVVESFMAVASAFRKSS